MSYISCYSVFSPLFSSDESWKKFEVAFKFCAFVRLEVEAGDVEERASEKRS